MRLQYPTNIKIIQLPCSGRVDILHLLKSFEDGADGVYVAGCKEGDCHFVTGNFKARAQGQLREERVGRPGPGARTD